MEGRKGNISIVIVPHPRKGRTKEEEAGTKTENTSSSSGIRTAPLVSIGSGFAFGFPSENWERTHAVPSQSQPSTIILVGSGEGACISISTL
jgi:hypothetical protein